MSTSIIKLASRGASVSLDTSVLDFQIPIGAGCGRSVITVGAQVDAALSQLDNPVTLIGRGIHFGGGAPDQGQLTDFDIEDLWLSERLGTPDPNDPTKVQWVLEDNRRWVQRLQSFGAMNLQRFGNEFEDLADGNFGQFHRIGKLAYLVATTRDPSGNIFARFDEQNVTVFTALEGALFMLTAFFDLFAKRAIKPDGTAFKPRVIFEPKKTQADLENGFPLQNFSLQGPWPVTTARLLRQAHCSFVPNNRGEWVVFRLDPRTFPRKVGGYQGAGNPVARDRRRSRAKIHRTFFRSRYEIRANLFETASPTPPVSLIGSVTDDDSSPVPISLANVVVMPSDNPDPDGGDTIRRGTVLEISQALRVWNANADQNYPQFFRDRFGQLSLGLVKRLTVGPALAWALSSDPTGSGQTHPRGRAIAKTLYDFYRRLVQIPKELRDNLGKIAAESVDVRDTRTAKVGPSLAYFDHTLVHTFHGFYGPDEEPEEGAGFAAIRPWPVGDATRLIEDAEASDYAKVTVFDQALGIFLVSPLTDVEGLFGRVIFTTFTELPSAFVGVDGIPQFLEQCTQDDEFRLSFLFSAEPITASPQNFYLSEAEAANADGPPVEEHVKQVFAGYAWRDGQSRASIGAASGQLEFEGFELINQARLDSIALGRRQQYYFEADDWVIGSFRAPGYDPNTDIPRGNYGVNIGHSKGLFEAKYTARNPRPRPIFELISPEAAELLFRFDEDRL